MSRSNSLNSSLSASTRIWHAQAQETIFSELDAGSTGLDTTEASQRMERYGPNRLPEAPPRSPLMRLLAQFHNLLIYVLLGAALIAGVMGHWVDNIVILGVVLVAVSVVVTLQLFFTYVPFMERFFGTRPVDCVQGVEIIALGVALYMIVELEKLTLRKWRRKHDGSSGCPGRSEAKS